MYATQVLVINELSPEESMYLHCLKKGKLSPDLVDNLASDYTSNKDNKLYTNYMNQFFYSHMKGEQFMVCEGLLNYFGTSSKEIAEQARKQTREQDDNYYLPQIEQLTSENQILKQLLAEHNIAY